ncbi:hypothetical protein EVAR_29608_1 [Eumeta japonica]|uniref:Uncharacterized protein n=1 Tax=Eumeta variegata TaxID=151549 RepID=A0A4C1VUE1_EUMVA|nr:hypothetical protein EVAR_29608_1 [Eumeta japonica]
MCQSSVVVHSMENECHLVLKDKTTISIRSQYDLISSTKTPLPTVIVTTTRATHIGIGEIRYSLLCGYHLYVQVADYYLEGWISHFCSTFDFRLADLLPTGSSISGDVRRRSVCFSVARLIAQTPLVIRLRRASSRGPSPARSHISGSINGTAFRFGNNKFGYGLEAVNYSYRLILKPAGGRRRRRCCCLFYNLIPNARLCVITRELRNVTRARRLAELASLRITTRGVRVSTSLFEDEARQAGLVPAGGCKRLSSPTRQQLAVKSQVVATTCSPSHGRCTLSRFRLKILWLDGLCLTLR